LTALKAEMREQFGDEPSHSPDFGRLCTTAHWERMDKLLATSGGEQHRVGAAPANRDTRYMPFTLIDKPKDGSPLLTEEIFGPLLPIVTFSSVAEAMKLIRSVDATPLALYIFTQNNHVAETILQGVQSGTAVVNDCVFQHVCHSLPFGGVGSSGHGSCHGRWSYETFTFPRSVLWRNGKFDIDQTVPLPIRHVSAKSSFLSYRPSLLKIMLLYGPYFSLPTFRQMMLVLAAVLGMYALKIFGA